MAVEYKDDDVLTAARKRIAAIYDDFERVVVSVSSGKDSTVLYHLALDEAGRRGRRLPLFFLDQEAEYQSSVDLMATMMRDERVEPLWFQVPLRMTNATSHRELFLYAWGPGETWMRDKDPVAIHGAPGAPDRFYDFFSWQEAAATVDTAWLVGLRSKESLNRFRAATSHAGHRDWTWTTKTASTRSVRAYPLYDWTSGDIWKFIANRGVAYNRHYDRMFARYGPNLSRMRVSNLIHEKSFRCLVDLHEFEPATYERLLARLGGVHAAALYGREDQVYDARALPRRFDSWRAYRDYLLATTPTVYAARFRDRFERQPHDEEIHRAQVKQILINDGENSVPVPTSRRTKLRALWWDRL